MDIYKVVWAVESNSNPHSIQSYVKMTCQTMNPVEFSGMLSRNLASLVCS